MIRRLLAVLLAPALALAVAPPADAAFVRVCGRSNVTWTFDDPLTVAPGAGTANVSYNNVAPVGGGASCRQFNVGTNPIFIGEVPSTQPANPVSLAGAYFGNCALAVLDGAYGIGVAVGGSVIALVNTGAFVTVSVDTVTPDLICNESEGRGSGYSVLAG